MRGPLLRKYSSRIRAFTILEVIVAVAIAAIPIIAVGILLSGASRGWERIYEDTNSPVRQDAIAFMVSLQKFGRQANVTNYQVYDVQNDVFTAAVPPMGESVASGEAVEFRYWQATFDPANPGSDYLDSANTGTHYALYYLDGEEIKVDFGRVVDGIGGVSDGVRLTGNIDSSQTLAQDVDLVQTTRLFSHVTAGGQGNGCINTELTVANEEGITIEIKFATMLRSAWPR